MPLAPRFNIAIFRLVLSFFLLHALLTKKKEGLLKVSVLLDVRFHKYKPPSFLFIWSWKDVAIKMQKLHHKSIKVSLNYLDM